MRPPKKLILVFILSISILAQLMAPPPARADGEIATPPAVETDPAPLPDNPTESAPADQPGLPGLLQEIPAETELIVQDAGGQPEPLASQLASEIIATSDPVWCPSSIQLAPTPGQNGCTASYASITALLLGEASSINADGTIWITSGAITEPGAVSIDGATYSNWKNRALTLQGGWSGISGDGTIGANSGFNQSISIIHWENDVTINNITVSGSTGTGFTIDTTGNVSMSNITASNNFGGDGLNVQSLGNISLENITASGNSGGQLYGYGNGAVLGNSFGTGDVTLTGVNEFNNNANVGLQVGSNGMIYSENITANDNLQGASLSNDGGTGDITLAGTNIFNRNTASVGDALYIVSAGNIWIHDLTVSQNAAAGAQIDNTPGTGDVTFFGSNSFDTNNRRGLGVVSKGNLLFNNLEASENSSGGAYLDNSAGTGNITLNGANAFISNTQGDGLAIRSNGQISLLNIEAKNNTAVDMNVSAHCGDFQFTNFLGDFVAPAQCQNDPENNTAILPILLSPVILNIAAIPEAEVKLNGTKIEFKLACDRQKATFVTLPNGDQIQIFCPVSGTARIFRLDNTNLPADLPAGYTYVSAYALDILQNGTSITSLTEGGHFDVRFQADTLQADTAYSILYWDPITNQWRALKEFMLDEQGNPREFFINPGSPDDNRTILSGVNLVFINNMLVLQSSVNFPGIFVLAQH